MTVRNIPIMTKSSGFLRGLSADNMAHARLCILPGQQNYLYDLTKALNKILILPKKY